MKIPTKTLTSLMVMTTVAAALPGASWGLTRRHRESKFDRILQHHDRKGELRAEVLGIDALEFRALQRQVSFPTIIRRYGFRDERAFRLALLGKLKDELRGRGWNHRRIERFVDMRSERI
jgi:hypothetical protein